MSSDFLITKLSTSQKPLITYFFGSSNFNTCTEWPLLSTTPLINVSYISIFLSEFLFIEITFSKLTSSRSLSCKATKSLHLEDGISEKSITFRLLSKSAFLGNLRPSSVTPSSIKWNATSMTFTFVSSLLSTLYNKVLKLPSLLIIGNSKSVS